MSRNVFRHEFILFSSDIDPVEKRYSTEWKNISLLDVLKRIESIPIADQYAAIGIRPWASEMDIPICEEDMNYQVYSSAFSKCTLNTCIAINATLTKDVKYDFAKYVSFMNIYIWWNSTFVNFSKWFKKLSFHHLDYIYSVSLMYIFLLFSNHHQS